MAAERHTFGSGTSHLPAFSFRFCLMVLLKTLARSTCKVKHQAHRTQGISVHTSILHHSSLHMSHQATVIPACAVKLHG
jgi:hypothetical protein